MKFVNEILAKIKGAENVDKILALKKRPNVIDVKNLVSALANDKTYKIDNFKTEEEFNISEALRSDLKKTIQRAQFPQKDEISVLDDVDICTEGLTKAIPYFVLEQLKTGRMFDLPKQNQLDASLYLKAIPGGSKEVNIRNVQTGKSIGTVNVITKDSFQLRAKSPVPKHLKRRVYKDPNGKPM